MPTESAMNDHSWPWDDDEMHAAAVTARRRTRWVLAVATIVLVCVLVQGLRVYGRLPDRLPLEVEIFSSLRLWDVSDMPKNPITAFAFLLFGVVVMVVACRVEATGDYTSWPGWEKTRTLAVARRGYLLLPVWEASHWVSATLAAAIALTQIGMWDLALQQSATMGFWPFPAGVILALAERNMGHMLATTRRKAALG